MPGLVVPFALFTGVYCVLSVILLAVLRRQSVETTPDGSHVG